MRENSASEFEARVRRAINANPSRPTTDCPNVSVKVRGWGIAQLGHGFSERSKPPGSEEVAALFKEHYMRRMVEAFGASRSMFEGNFPVDKVSMR